MNERKLRATIKLSHSIASGFLKLNRYEFDTEKHDGGSQVVVREVMERGHAIAVLAYDPHRDAVVLVNEFRPGRLVAGLDPYSDNLAAGGIAAGETPVQAAVRELKEETGLDLSRPELIHSGAFVSSGGTSEMIAIVAGVVDSTQAGGIHGNADEFEDIRSVVLPAEEFIRRVRTATVDDLKTLVAGYWLAENRERLRPR